MKTYHISWESTDSRGRLRGAVFSAALGMVILGAIKLWRHSFSAVDWLGFGFMYALFSYFFPPGPQSYDLEIDDDGIRQLRNGMIKRTLLKDRIRSVREWNGGKTLVISEHGPVWTRLLWGGIAVPKTVADYEEIRERTLGWLQQATNARMARPSNSNS